MVSYKVNKDERTIKCTLIDFGRGEVRKSVGIAVCSPEDEWNEELGKKIAFNRARIQEVGSNISDYTMDLKKLDNQYKMLREMLEKKIDRQRKVIRTLHQTMHK